jgi:2-keto-3-deoxy-L-arabinonate dehydratase
MSAHRDGDAATANEQFTHLLPLLIFGLQSGIAWAVHKEVLVRRGVIASSRVRAPAAALDQSSQEGLLRALAPFEKATSWRVP